MIKFIIKNRLMLQERISTEYIAIDPDYCFGKPRIVGTRISVATVAKMYLEMGESLEDIGREYDLPLASLYAAIAYYYDHQEEIELQSAESQAFVEQLKQKIPPSLLQEKFKEIRGE